MEAQVYDLLQSLSLLGYSGWFHTLMCEESVVVQPLCAISCDMSRGSLGHTKSIICSRLFIGDTALTQSPWLRSGTWRLAKIEMRSFRRLKTVRMMLAAGCLENTPVIVDLGAYSPRPTGRGSLLSILHTGTLQPVRRMLLNTSYASCATRLQRTFGHRARDCR